jgi:hypothetical protein
MPPLSDAKLIARFLEALKEWKYDGYINWSPRATRWLRENLQNHSQQAIGRAMYNYVRKGGVINQAKENYEGYRDDHPYHYDYEIPMSGKIIYVETVFDDMTMGPTITVVNIKYSNKR